MKYCEESTDIFYGQLMQSQLPFISSSQLKALYMQNIQYPNIQQFHVLSQYQSHVLGFRVTFFTRTSIN